MSTSKHQRTASVVIERFHPLVRNALRGFADVAIPDDGITIHGISVLQCGSWCSIRLPTSAAPRFFCTPPHYLEQHSAQRFEQAVITALRAAHPEAFADGEATQ